MVAARASAASAPSMTMPGSSTQTMAWICSLAAWPAPTTAFLMALGAYSATGRPDSDAASKDRPAFLSKGKQSSLGNIDQSDLIVPRVKLLQAISPELDEYDHAVKRQFWHTIAAELMGDSILGIPLIVRKSYVLWAPRNDDRGILARSTDGKKWDPGFENLEFEVKPKGSAHAVKYETKGSVAESGLAQFGSSIPGDAQSAPAASLTYNMLWYFPEHPELSPAVIINTRSAVKPAKGLISKIEMRPVDHFAQQFRIGITDEKGDEGPYYGYSYTAAGYVESEEQYNEMKALYERFKEESWRANEEDEEAASAGGGGSATSDKF